MKKCDSPIIVVMPSCLCVTLFNILLMEMSFIASAWFTDCLIKWFWKIFHEKNVLNFSSHFFMKWFHWFFRLNYFSLEICDSWTFSIHKNLIYYLNYDCCHSGKKKLRINQIQKVHRRGKVFFKLNWTLRTNDKNLLLESYELQ